MSDHWTTSLLELIRRSSCDLPADVAAALAHARASEAPESRAAALLGSVLENAVLARSQQTPICQDTGTLTFFWQVPRQADLAALEAAARAAVSAATQQGGLRRNTIDALSGRSVDSNVAEGSPVCHFEPWDRAETEVWLLQKGGGSENMSAQYSLPDESLHAGRDFEGVRRCVLHAVWRAQGQGCAPGILGVCVGADRGEGYITAKRQLLRPLDDCATTAELAELERRVLSEANELGIGPMGMSGRTTLLGVKIAGRTRLPASYFVTVAYMCWACRRRGLRADPGGAVLTWLG
jgi:fumarate hydratase class I